MRSTYKNMWSRRGDGFVLHTPTKVPHKPKPRSHIALECETNTQTTLMSSAEFFQNMEPFALSQFAIFGKRNAITKTTIHLVLKVKITYTHS